MYTKSIEPTNQRRSRAVTVTATIAAVAVSVAADADVRPASSALPLRDFQHIFFLWHFLCVFVPFFFLLFLDILYITQKFLLAALSLCVCVCDSLRLCV